MPHDPGIEPFQSTPLRQGGPFSVKLLLGLLRRVPKPTEQTGEYEVKLVFLEHSEFPDGPRVLICRDALH